MADSVNMQSKVVTKINAVWSYEVESHFIDLITDITHIWKVDITHIWKCENTHTHTIKKN